jgi:hypothetical protein
MKPISQNRKPRSVFRLDPPSCALPPKKVLLPGPRICSNRDQLLLHHRLQAILLLSHQAHRSIAYVMPPIHAIENP